MKKVLLWLGGLLLIVLIGAAIYLKTPAGAPLDTDAVRAEAAAYDARIIRDDYGVPHIFGERDADTAFGFAYAHAEDDFSTIQQTIAFGRGMTSQYEGKDAAPADFMFDLFRVDETVDRIMPTLPADIRAVAKGYADGLNLYAANNPEETLPGLFPVTERDVHAGFVFGTPFFYRLDGYLTELFTAEDAPDVSPWNQTAQRDLSVRGSNAFAIAPSRSADGHTRLIVNSHQPMEGRYAWYEAHTVSNEGLNLAGATFPGVPILTQGVTPNLGWAHTVNRPDLVDIYKLEVEDDRYRLDGEWRDFDVREATFRMKLFGPFSLPVKRRTLWSAHGPVIEAPTGAYAVKFAGLQEHGALEQWYRMGKATNAEEWRDALTANGVLSFNIVYGDREGHIAHVYNARMPDRIEGPDWKSILPGDQSQLIWDSYRSPEELPQIWDPECGWVFSANATPFKVTDEACNLRRADFSPTFGIEDRITNRSLRARALFEPDPAITREELLRYRADTAYDPTHRLMQMVVEIVGMDANGDEAVQAAQEVLRNWDGRADRDSRAAALAIITGTRTYGYEYDETPDGDDVLRDSLRQTMDDLTEKFGRIDPEWGEVNRIIRGDESHPLDGGPDVLRAIYADRDGVAKDGVMNAFAGDTHIMVADWSPDGELRLDTILQYGAATTRPDSPHYNDQVELFAEQGYKPMPMTLEAVLAVATEDYRPGER
jgi:penicillin amidase/acyl-homoserine-lactone acylase